MAVRSQRGSGVINLSVGPEHRISVKVDGWVNENKIQLKSALADLGGVMKVSSAGGGTSFYVYYDPEVISEDLLREAIGSAADSIFLETNVGNVQTVDPAEAPPPKKEESKRDHSGDEAISFDPSDWTGDRLVSVSENALKEIRVKSKRLFEVVEKTNFRSEEDKDDIVGLTSALVAVCEMAEPDVTLIGRITSHPKFRTYEAVIVFVAAIRGAIGF